MFEDHSIPPGSSRSDASMLDSSFEKHPAPLSLRQRIRHFTWAWYTLTMSAGGLALLLGSQPNTFRGLQEIGLAVYLLNLLLFALVSSTMAVRFCLHGGMIESLCHEREGLFFATFWLSIATIISGLYRYFGTDAAAPFWLALEVLFWIYCACTLIAAVVQYSFLFGGTHAYRLQTAMPGWILPAFPVMLSGTIASVITAQQPARSAVPILVAGTSFQGLGFFISLLMYSHYVGRLMESGLPCREHRPGMFIAVGPPAFTALALVGIAQNLPPGFQLLGDDDARVLQLLAIAVAVFLWALSLWFFCIAAIAVLRAPPTAFHLSWWAMVFPNTGFTLATITLGQALQSPGVCGVGSAMSVAIVGMFLFVLVSHVRAVLRRDIMYPGKDEDVSD